MPCTILERAPPLPILTLSPLVIGRGVGSEGDAPRPSSLPYSVGPQAAGGSRDRAVLWHKCVTNKMSTLLHRACTGGFLLGMRLHFLPPLHRDALFEGAACDDA